MRRAIKVHYDREADAKSYADDLRDRDRGPDYVLQDGTCVYTRTYAALDHVVTQAREHGKMRLTIYAQEEQ